RNNPSTRPTTAPADERRGGGRQQGKAAWLGIHDVNRTGRGNPGRTAIEAQLREDVEEAVDLEGWRRVHDGMPTGRSQCRALPNHRTEWQTTQIQRKHLRAIGVQGRGSNQSRDTGRGGT